MESNKIKTTNTTSFVLNLAGNEAQNIEQIIKEKPPQISLLRKEDEEKTIKNIAALILDLNESLNIKVKMNTEQILSCAKDILNEFWMITLLDIKIALNRIKNGKVKIFENLDQSKIFPVIESYLDQKTNLVELMNEKKHKEIKAAKLEPDSLVYDLVKDSAKRLGFDKKEQSEEEYRKFKADYVKKNIEK